MRFPRVFLSSFLLSWISLFTLTDPSNACDPFLNLLSLIEDHGTLPLKKKVTQIQTKMNAWNGGEGEDHCHILLLKHHWVIELGHIFGPALSRNLTSTDLNQIKPTLQSEKRRIKEEIQTLCSPSMTLPLFCRRTSTSSQGSPRSNSSEYFEDHLRSTLRGDVRFRTDRDLKDYQALLPEEFSNLLSSMHSDSHWIDAGSGASYAIETFMRERKRKLEIPYSLLPWVTGITYQFERNIDDHGKKIKIISGQYFEALSGLMKADLITDIYGVFSYSGKLDEVLRKYLDLLNPNGTLFIASSIADTWVKVGRREMTLQKWLEGCSGMNLEVLKSEHLGVSILKIKHYPNGQVSIVPRLKLVQTALHGLPPHRRTFEELSSQ